jgi:serine/threonine protein kinase
MQGISLLNHPFLAAILDYGEIDGRLYVVRRYLSNGSLLGNAGRLWFKPPLSVEDALRYGRQLAQALDSIHNHGYLHGAITFSNVLVLRGPNVEHEPDYAPFLLSDVGLTNYVRRFGQPPNNLLPVTAAPEQVGKRVTPASDQFALAVLLYFWLAGRPPYLGAPEEIEQAKLTGAFPPLFTLNPDTPYELDEALRRALSVYPEERYPSIAAFADALMALLTLSPVETSLPDPRQPEPFSASTSTPITQADPSPVNDLTPMPQIETGDISAVDPELSPLEQILNVLAQPIPYVFQSKTRPLPESTTPPAEERPAQEEIPMEQGEEVAVAETEMQAAQSTTTPSLLISRLSEVETREFLLGREREEIMLGRAGSDDVLLDQDPSISRHHALLKVEDGRYLIYDLRSSSGVFVNDEKLTDGEGRVLADGNHIRIGNYELIFRCSSTAILHEEKNDAGQKSASDTEIGVSS